MIKTGNETNNLQIKIKQGGDISCLKVPVVKIFFMIVTPSSLLKVIYVRIFQDYLINLIFQKCSLNSFSCSYPLYRCHLGYAAQVVFSVVVKVDLRVCNYIATVGRIRNKEHVDLFLLVNYYFPG